MPEIASFPNDQNPSRKIYLRSLHFFSVRCTQKATFSTLSLLRLVEIWKSRNPFHFPTQKSTGPQENDRQTQTGRNPSVAARECTQIACAFPGQAPYSLGRPYRPVVSCAMKLSYTRRRPSIVRSWFTSVMVREIGDTRGANPPVPITVAL